MNANEITINAASFEGRNYDEVAAELTNLGLAVNGNPVESADFDAGIVLDVNPVGVLSRGDTVTVTYSTGAPVPSTTTVPTGLTGLQGSAAAQQISAAGLVPVNGGTQPSDQPAGTVVAVNPSEGAPVPEGSTVTFFTSAGPAAPAPTGSTQGNSLGQSTSSIPAG